MNIFRFILKKLFILQTINNKNKSVKLGRGFMYANRINPYNPLSYITILLIFILGIILFGIIGFWKEIEFKNPFKWD